MNRRENALSIFRKQKPELIPRSSDYCNMFFPGERSPTPVEGDDLFGVHWLVIPNSGQMVDHKSGHVLTDITEWKNQVKFPTFEGFDFKADAEKQLASWDKENQAGMVVLFNGHFERMHALMGFEEALVAICSEREAAAAFFDAMTEYKLLCINLAKEFYNPDILVVHDDWGTHNSLFFSPDLWRELISPHVRKLVDETHRLGMYYEQHSCGRIESVIGDLVDMGIDSIQTLQAPINDVKMIKEKYGGRLIIRGGSDGQTVLAPGTSEERIRRIARESLESLVPGGNHIPFIFAFGNDFEKPMSIFNDEVDRFEEEFLKNNGFNENIDA